MMDGLSEALHSCEVQMPTVPPTEQMTPRWQCGQEYRFPIGGQNECRPNGVHVKKGAMAFERG
ncbi:hypothetical protein ZHAS_00019648 [Anopheles sinensis]|uniref:Uncharacterized protein n=1 Tax=Anopheles sinensis TaxID=74873 RepID=A0A084WMY4_ANOSI|nr:hypothetical protein ZHAS_00019648 [Anopheles sinensis]